MTALAGNVIQSKREIEVVGQQTIVLLKQLAWSHPSKRSRILLHHSDADKCQEMVLCLHQKTYLRPHKHPAHKSESYLLLEGEMDVVIYQESGEVSRVIHLNRENFLYRMIGGWYHQPVPKTDWAIYKEVYAGPFHKDFDVVYSPWSNPEKV